jgi:hypothetical protein
MPIDAADLEFIRTAFHEVEGWCCDEAAYLTCCLLNAQAAAGLANGMLEIGVYKGKYLSVLLHAALRHCLPVVGIDTFQWSNRDEVLETLTRHLPSTDALTIITANSLHYTADSLLDVLGGRKPSFISVDGDHSAAAVTSDLFLSQAVLSGAGIIAIDDFLNPRAIGVSEGTYRYFLTADKPLRPFAYCANKLFVAALEHHTFYRDAIAAFMSEMPDLAMVREFIRMRNQGQAFVEQPLLDTNVLIF